MRIHGRKATAFSIVELLVVIAIIAILVGLLMGAVQRAREAASRTRCQNNLKQMGLALHLYENAVGHFPTSKSPAWSVSILPYIDQTALSNQFTNTNWLAPANNAIIKTPLQLFMCPSASGSVRYDNSVAQAPACGDYGTITRVNPQTASILGLPSQNLSGFMPDGGPTSVSDVTDGMSNTIAVAEDAGRPQLYRKGALVSGGQTRNGAGWADPKSAFRLKGADDNGNFSGARTCFVNCTNDNEIYSFHPTGANVLFADGAVRFFSEHIAPLTLAGLVTRANGEVASPP